MSKSYDTSKLFSSNRSGAIKDDFCYSPALKENYDYKQGIVKEFHIGGVMDMKEPQDSKYQRKMDARQARMEQDYE